eukprot:CAMPEP_0177626218 /NCGR_PEP_ID=MMETSP0419_2-20121207/30533_1 /TAXON_ID=582737 /ORGANISM="Tetraselmis sp., Strain GSL018" /LENGTH=1165 /DNA_ID=CAMNT_0019127251 /DNA_START=304 /DNA_END=3806 /DNA_ORIENTATION=-
MESHQRPREHRVPPESDGAQAQGEPNISDFVAPEDLPHLAVLDLSANLLPDLDVVEGVLSALPSLRDLNLAGNPCASGGGYAGRMLAACPNLRLLDGRSAAGHPAEPCEREPLAELGTPVQLQQTAAAAPLSARGVSGEWPQCHASQGVPVPLRARTGEEAAPGRAGRQPTRMHRQALPGLTGRGGLSGHTMLDLPAIIQQQMQHRWDALLAPPKQRGGIWQARAFRALPVRPPLLLGGTGTRVPKAPAPQPWLASTASAASERPAIGFPLEPPWGWHTSTTSRPETLPAPAVGSGDVNSRSGDWPAPLNADALHRCPGDGTSHAAVPLRGCRELSFPCDQLAAAGERWVPWAASPQVEALFQAGDGPGGTLPQGSSHLQADRQAHGAGMAEPAEDEDAARQIQQNKTAESSLGMAASLGGRVQDAFHAPRALSVGTQTEPATSPCPRPSGAGLVLTGGNGQRGANADATGAWEGEQKAMKSAAEDERRRLKEKEAEVAELQERLAAAEGTVASLRAYVGRDEGLGQGVASAGDAVGSNRDGTPASRGVEAEESTVELLQRQLSAMQEIAALQEAQMGGAAPAGPALLSAWRQEVFRSILLRKAAEVREAEQERRATARQKALEEELRREHLEAQVAQKKVVSLQAELEMSKAALASARREAEQARMSAEKSEEDGARARAALELVVDQAKRADETAAAAEGALAERSRQLVSFGRRLRFAEERLKVLRALRDAAAEPSPAPGVSVAIPEAVRETVAAAGREQEDSALARECEALQTERSVLLSRLEGFQRTAEQARDAALARERERAGEELRSALAEQEQELRRMWAAAERGLREQLASEGRASAAGAERERDEARERLQEMRQEMRAQQAESASTLARCEADLGEARRAAEAADRRAKETEAEMARRLGEAEQRREEDLASAKAEHEEAKRQGAKAMVTVRQLERQVARLHSQQTSLEDVRALERKLREKDDALRAVRRERNALLASQRAPAAGAAAPRASAPPNGLSAGRQLQPGSGPAHSPEQEAGPEESPPAPEEPPAIPAKAETLRERGARGRGSWTGSRTSSALRSPSLRTMASDSWQGGNSDVANPGVNSSLKSPGLQPRRLECLQGFNSDCSVPVCREGSFWAGAKVICIIHQARRGVYSEAVAVSQVDTRYELSS